MAFCKDCFYHNLCNAHDELILTADELYELVYQNGVELLCKHFKRKEDVQETKHGEWINEGEYLYKCSLCGDKAFLRLGGKPCRYCPSCGAEMKVGA